MVDLIGAVCPCAWPLCSNRVTVAQKATAFEGTMGVTECAVILQRRKWKFSEVM